MSKNSVSSAFQLATTTKEYKAALAKARRLGGEDQLTVLDDMFDAAKRLGVRRSTGEPLGMQQQLDGSVTVTWRTKVTHPDQSVTSIVESAVLEPNDYGSGWHSKGKDVPEEVVDAVTAAALANELKPLAGTKKRIYVREQKAYGM